MSIFRRFALSLVLVLGLAPASALAQQPGIVVNGQPLSIQEVLHYGVDLPPGRYWYDQISGLWGFEGGPSVGQIAPGVPLGGALRIDASSGNTGVFINGREIHMLELLELRAIFGEVPLGRFSVAPDQSQAGGGSSGYFEDKVADFFIQNGQPVPDMPGPVYE